jgi:hypothetical protein
MSTFTSLSMALCYSVEYVSRITDATMMPVSRRVLSNQSHSSISSIFLFLLTYVCPSLTESTQYFFAFFSRVLVHAYFCIDFFAYSLSTSKYVLSRIANRREREAMYRDVQQGVHHYDSIFLSIFFFFSSLFLFYSYQYRDDLRSYHRTTHVRKQHDLNQFISIYYLPTCIYLNIYRHSSFTSQAKKKKITYRPQQIFSSINDHELY